MKKESLQYKNGLTLIEVMVSMVVILIVAMGAVSYMYASAKHAREADVRATAGRIGLLLLEGWKGNGVDVTTFNPADVSKGFNKLPLSDFATPVNLNVLPGLTNTLKTYRIETDKVKYFVKMTYGNYAPSDTTPRQLSISVAWNRNYSDTALGANYNTVVISDYAIY
jgi:prepilin-type N-terminal cleavage/methylation domain-containing protein